jgi:PhoPQ-activated pathogenicity-related protein
LRLTLGPLALLIAALAPGRAPAAPPEVPSELTDYVGKPDDSFSWKLAGKAESDAGTVYTIELVSQTWHDIKWDHKLQVYVAKGTKPQPTMVLWNQGGTPGAASELLGIELSKKVNAPVAFLFGIPKQPLFGGKKEDALIAETFVKYLETKDGSWPLLFPMVKSLVRAMDALQAFAKEEWKSEVKDFVVTGASKRGWTTWLTAATGDKRVKAIAPLVIDTLNIPQQMKNQVEAFGKPSEMIKDYVDRKLIPLPKTEAAERLWKMIDPWTYREKITIPKLIICGTNDPYWPLDALNTYWDDLKGDKWVCYVPNAGHDLIEVGKDGKKDLLPARAINTLAAFSRAQIFGKPMAKTSAKYTDTAAGVDLEVGIEGTLISQRVWVADAETRDFRKARWSDKVLSETKGGGKVLISGPVSVTLSIRRPETGFRAVLVETEFEVDGLKHTLCTQLRILEAKK